MQTRYKFCTSLLPVCSAAFFFFSSTLFSNTAKAQPLLTFTPIIKNLTLPIAVRNAGDGSGRLFICEQGGLIKIYKNGSLLSRPFLDLTNLVKNDAEYPGLYSIAFPPDYASSHLFFVHYVGKDGLTVLARYKTSKTNPDSAIAGSGVIVLKIDGKGSNSAHTGDMHFAKDGYLYMSINDGSYYSRTTKFAQDGQSLLGKMLRLNVRIKDSPYYSIPVDNPFINDPNVRDEIWAMGLRNAWRWSFDRKNGDMWIADVGGDKREEVDVRTPRQSFGANFGWPCYEGNAIFDTTSCAGIGNYVFPVWQYPHINTTSAEVITGGYVYRGSAYPAMKGYYICTDYTTGNVWKIIRNDTGISNAYLQTGLPIGIVDFGEDENAELYATSISEGKVYRVQATAPETIIAKTTAENKP
jgi:glucose/arabinose dehydrogenase